MTGQPPLSFSLGESKSGLPIGVQFMPRFGEEAALIRLASGLKRKCLGIIAFPPVHAFKADSWLLSFTYTHSTHNVIISLATSGAGGTLFSIEVLILIAAVIAIAVAAAVGLIVWRKKKETYLF